MKYEQLTIDQRIGLKGYFKTEPELAQYRMVWLFWGFKKAVEYFLNDDINAINGMD